MLLFIINIRPCRLGPILKLVTVGKKLVIVEKFMGILLANRAKIRLRQAKKNKVRKLAYTLIIFNIGNDVLTRDVIYYQRRG